MTIEVEFKDSTKFVIHSNILKTLSRFNDSGARRMSRALSCTSREQDVLVSLARVYRLGHQIDSKIFV
jgi:hypothetical protein